MNTLSKKISLCTLALFMILSMVSCLGKDTESASDTTNEATQREDSSFELDNIPDEIDYDGAVVKVLYDAARTDEFDPSSSGSAVDASIVSRNFMVEERLGVYLQFVPTLGGYNNGGLSPLKQTLDNDIMSAGEYDICADYAMTIGSCVVSGNCVDLMQHSILDFDAPWWSSGLKNATIGNRLYFGTGDISTSYISTMFCMFYNSQLVTDLNLEDPNTMVKLDNWKWEYFIEYCTDIYVDLDNVDGKTAGDRYAISAAPLYGEAIFYSGGSQYLELNSDGALTLAESLSNNRATDFYDQMESFLNGSEDVYVDNDTENLHQVFENGRSVFTIAQLNYAAELSSTEIEYGILPLPKYDDNQDYRSVCWVGRTLYFISKGSDAAEMAATTMECMASEGYRRVTPILYEEVYKLRYSKDAISGQMLDIIRNSIVFDLAQVFTYSFENQLPTRMSRSLVFGSAAGYSENAMWNISTAMGTYRGALDAAVAEIVGAYAKS